MVKPPDQTPAGDLGHDVLEAVVGIPRLGGVVEGQQNAGKGLNEEEEQGNAAEDLVPAAGGGNILVEEVLDGRLEPGAMVHPIQDSSKQVPHWPPFSGMD